MNLNCLNCQSLQRTDSDRRHEHDHKVLTRLCCTNVERSWSGNLVPPPYEQMRSSEAVMMAVKKVKKGHRRLHSTGAVAFEGRVLDETGEPRLVRSCGMRRDWSFEDLRQRRDEMIKRKGGRGF